MLLDPDLVRLPSDQVPDPLPTASVNIESAEAWAELVAELVTLGIAEAEVPSETVKHNGVPVYNGMFGVHKAWVETKHEEGGLGGSLNYPLLADLNKSVAEDYGVLAGAGVALRGLFLIDPNGVVAHATIINLPVGRSAKEALRTLSAFQFVAENDGKVCPADWEEGADPMDASPEGMRNYLTSH